MKFLKTFIAISLKLILINNFAYSMKSPFDSYSEPSGKQINNYIIGNIDASAIELMRQLFDKNSKPILSDDTQKTIHDFFSFLYDYKGTLGLTTATGFFLYPLYRTYKINNFLKKKDLWLSWKEDLPFDQLTSSTDLAKELLNEIRKKCIKSKRKPKDSFALLMQFKENIEDELNELESYLNHINWINSSVLSSIYPSNEDLATVIEEKIKRLNYLSNIFSDLNFEFKTKS